MEMNAVDEVRDMDGAVLTCTAAECSYNKTLECWAPKVEIGDDHPRCDMYTHNAGVVLAESASIVSWCGVGECGFNEGAHCSARGITVDHHGTHADCATFRP